jgi:acetyl esterase
MPLDPQAQAVLSLMDFGALPDLATLEPATIRAALKSLPVPGTVEPVAAVAERELPGPGGHGVRARIYTPETAGPAPVLMYFHGGGFCICDLDTHDGTCRALANAAGALVISVDYRLAPEAKFPAAPEDCYAATCWAAANAAEIGGDPERIAVAGDSAGGGLAAVVTLMARDRRGPKIAHQLLVYPVTNYAFDTESYEACAEGYMLTRDMMMWFWRHYLAQPEDGSSPMASPLRAKSLARLPPATILTAEFDPLRDEGEAYAKRLAEAGVATTLRRYEGMIHGFFSMPEAIDRARLAVREAAQDLRRAFAS